MIETGRTQVGSRDRTYLMDILRGLLASWVVLHHIVLTARFNPDVYPFRLLAHHGQEAVLVFFILSGFAIANSLSTTSQCWSCFLIARFWRIYPVYVVALAAGLTVCVIVQPQAGRLFADFDRLGIESWNADEGSPRWLHLLLHLSQLHGMIPMAWLPHADATFIAPAWSLSTEFQFYAIAPAMCFPLLIRSTGTWWWLAATLMVATFIAEFAMTPAIAPACVLRYLDLFALGIAGAALHQSDGRGRLLYVLLAVSVAAAGLHAGRIIVANAVAVWLLFWLASTAMPARLMHSRLATIALFIGALSYPLYLIHYPLMRLALLAAREAFPLNRGGFLAVWIPMTIVLTYAVAALLHRYIEIPGTRFGKRVATRRNRRRCGTSVSLPANVPPLRRLTGGRALIQRTSRCE